MKMVLQLLSVVTFVTASWASGPICQPPFLVSNFGVVANDVGMGQDGTAWTIGPNGVNLLLRGSAWGGTVSLGHPGGQTTNSGRIAAGPDGSPWAVDDNNGIWHFTTSWQQFPGLARDIAVTADGTPWVVGTLQATGGFHIYFWNGNNWVQVAGAGTRIAAGPTPDFEPWLINSSQHIFHRNSNGTWATLTGLGVDIGVDLQDTPWVLGTPGAQGGGQVIYHFTGGIWQSDANAPGGVAITGSGGGVGGMFGCGAFFVDSAFHVQQLD